MELLIVILNYRTGRLTVDCLRSLAPQVTSGIRAVVVDNASGDDSLAIIGGAIEAEG